MNFSCIFLLALALFGAVSQAYISSGTLGYGAVGAVGAVGHVGPVGYNGLYETACGAPYGGGYAAGYETGYGCRGSCATACGPSAVCDACQCMKTIVRPIVERIPYSCSRRVQSSTCRTGCGVYSGAGYGVGGGAVGGTCGGYVNSGYVY